MPPLQKRIYGGNGEGEGGGGTKTNHARQQPPHPAHKQVTGAASPHGK
jgi:hypothetical protein